MDEKRKSARRRVLKAATIAFNGGAAIDCVMKNISDVGAALQVDTPVGIPDHFTLISDGERIGCRVIWRKSNRIGIAFERE